jgi:hypothetical protein
MTRRPADLIDSIINPGEPLATRISRIWGYGFETFPPDVYNIVQDIYNVELWL